MNLDFKTTQEDENYLAWLESIDVLGLAIDLQELKKKLESAPPAARETPIFSYLHGFYDGRFLHEELKKKEIYQ
jgi:hypothetical protein